ncbi:unnamed protein product [Arabidopsis halleri]
MAHDSLGLLSLVARRSRPWYHLCFSPAGFVFGVGHSDGISLLSHLLASLHWR